MVERAQSGGNDPGLDRLFEDLVRDGWLMGMNAGVDPAAVRMDGPTGTCNRPYFVALCSRAIEDAISGHGPRPEDGPAQGEVALMTLRILDWEDLAAALGDAEREGLAARVARLLEAVLRVDDVIGRVAPDTFSLLLRGCPHELHDLIAGRCQVAIEKERYAVDGAWSTLRCRVQATIWAGEGAEDFVTAACRGLLDG